MNGTIAGGVTCGNCTKANGGLVVKHPSAADVRNCYAGRYRSAETRAVESGYRSAMADPAASFARDFPELVEGHVMTDAEETRELQRRDREDEERAQASKATRDAVSLEDPWAAVNALREKLPALPKMHYAIEVLDFEVGPEPVWKFYRVDKPTRGRWAGKTFVSAQASDDYWPVKRPAALVTILTAIAANPEKAAADYGHQIGRCGVCSRTLTDPESIARGIGPVCAGKAGWSA